MKITKQQEKEIMQVYNAYWDNYLQGDVEAMQLLLDDEYTQVGSAEGEVFLNKKDAVQFLYDTIDQVADKLEMRNRSTIPEQQGELILIHERCDLYALADGGWIFYSKFRASTLLKETKQGWKITHQHSSFPDARAADGENIAINKIAAENLQLREAVKRCTIELEQINRELEIEAALERVRSRTMAMHHSNELADVAKVLFQQVKELDIKAWTAGFNIWQENNSSYIDWVTDPKGDFLEPYTVDLTSHPFFTAVREARQRGDGFFVSFIEGEQIEEVYRLLSSFCGKGQFQKIQDAGFQFPVSQYNHYVFGAQVSLMFITYEPCPEGWDIFKRFGKVFEQTYTRFLDLQKAEAQAREAQIESALERVRSRSMGMQKSENLKEVIKIVFQQLRYLKINLDHAGFVVDYTPFGDWHFWIADEQDIPSKITHPYFESVWARQFNDAKEKAAGLFATHLNFEEKNKFYNELLSFVPGLPETVKDFYLGCPALAASTVLLDNVGLYIENFSGIPYSDEENNTLMRFGKVFQQTYTRFLDLQKAEAQAREAQIETALERVRSRTMAMQKSEELPETSKILFQQMKELGEPTEQLTIGIVREAENIIEISATVHGDVLKKIYSHSIDEQYVMRKVFNAWKAKEKTLVIELIGEELNAYNRYRNKITGTDMFPTNLTDENRRIMYLSFFAKGMLAMGVTEPRPPESLQLLERFAAVFNLTYTRFLDLQRAEVQTREAQIELALERVRARTMAMQQSEELSETAYVLFQQFSQLGEVPDQITIGKINEEERVIELWLTMQGALMNRSIKASIDEPTVMHKMYTAWKEQQKSLVIDLTGQELQDYISYRNKLSESNKFPVVTNYSDERRVINVAFFSKGFITFSTPEPKPTETIQLLERFANVFEQTYIRFLDLQKAEAQAREAQIETGLERVRSRSLAMHNTSELQEVIHTVHKELLNLNIAISGGSFITINNDIETTLRCWGSGGTADTSAEVILPLYEKPFCTNLISRIKKGPGFFTEEFTQEEKIEFFTFLFKHEPWSKLNAKQQQETLSSPGGYTRSCAVSIHTSIFIINHFGKIFSEDENEILKRFAKVFEQAYTRFLDLQKAEAQAREAQIEAALERVRSVAMSMMKSDDLFTICQSAFAQLQILGFKNLRTAQVYIRNDDEEKFMNYDYSEVTGASKVEVNYNSHSNTRRIYDVIKNAGDGLVYNVIEKEQLEEWKSYLYNTLGQPPEESLDAADGLHYYLYSFGIGAFGICTFIAISKEELAILKRFRNVFNLSYQRYTDIALAEAQAREAKIETALERVRSRTLAMQKSDELAETATEVFRQLISLGIEPNRLYIGIVKAETGDMEMWATDEDGTHVGKKFMFNKNENASVKKLFDGWKAKEKSVIVDMQGKELEDYFHYLNNVMHIPFKDGLTQKRRVQSVAYFSKGFIGMASPDGQGDQTIQLLERFAAVFNLTFTRFNDLKIAEAHAEQAVQDLIAITEAKKKAEEALTVLQTTQKQLIQSEKMASLGELTAGIAHEIQNPLNFVNNFSDVSNELLDELMEEMTKGNLEDVKEILNDVKQNLQKINHHGKRADAIVKGMLQHSRSSSGVKEPTDINALCDEYLRLCYHGLRAKDNSFNATMKTDFDESIGNIKIIPQDIGRVILNLITNAFYAAPLPPKGGFSDPAYKHEPTVWVKTSQNPPLGDRGASVLISVRDNGPGIPQKILDKIFQPFFTTKPTGHGTGLGLSLSYDIVRAHGGEIRVETKEGEGSEFIIQLPVV